MSRKSSKKFEVVLSKTYQKKVRGGRKPEYQEIAPSDIKIEGSAAGKFGKFEVEQAAGDLVKFFQEKESWEPFYLYELLDFYKRNILDRKRMLFGLICPWEDDGIPLQPRIRSYKNPHMISCSTGQLAITSQFIERLLARD
jgi:hypothetical protein